MGQHELRNEDRRPLYPRRYRLQLPQKASGVHQHSLAAARSLGLGERGEVGVPRDKDVGRSGIEGWVHRRPCLAGEYRFDPLLRSLRGRVMRRSARAHRPQCLTDGVAPYQEEDPEDPQYQEQEKDGVQKNLVHLGQLAVAAEKQARLTVGRAGDRVRNRLVDSICHEQRHEQVRNDLSRQIVEISARDPGRNRHQRVDHLYLREVQARRYLPVRRDAPGAVHHDVMPQRRIQRIVVIPDAVFGIELVAVLAVDYPPPPARLDGGQIIVGELVDEATLAQCLLNLLVPERLRVVVPWQVDHALVRRLSKPLQRGEAAPVLGAFDGHRCPVLPVSNLAYLQEIEEIPSQDQLDRPFSASKLHEKSLELFGRLEPVATTVPPDVRIGDEDYQAIATQLQHAPSLAQTPVP